MLAEDLTQSVFEKLIKYKESFNGKKSFKAWLFAIVRNTNIDHHRRRKLDPLDERAPQLPSDERDAHQRMEAEEKKKSLMDAINKLPEEEKEILMLSKFERLKYSEISKIMGISESSLKVKAHRSIKKLRTILVNDVRYEY